MKIKITIFKYAVMLLVSYFFIIDTQAAQIGFEADSAYLRGDYTESIRLYNEIEETQGISAALLYNMGNAYYQNSDYGNAMLCYERAYKLNPYSKEIKQNLNYLKNKIEDTNKGEQKGKKLNVSEDAPTFFQSMHKSIAIEITSDRWAIWGVISFLILLLSIGIYIFTTNVILRKIGFFGSFVFISTTIICIVFSCLAASAFNQHEEGIITAYKVILYTEPKEEKSEHDNTLTQGTKVRVISEEIDAEGNVNWYKVRLNSDYIGWIKSSELAII